MLDDPARGKGHGRVRGSAVKLAIVRQKYTPFGGAERFVERALASLKAQHVDVDIIARQWTTPTATPTPSPLPSPLPSETPSAGHRVNPFYIRFNQQNLSKLFVTKRIDRLKRSGFFGRIKTKEYTHC